MKKALLFTTFLISIGIIQGQEASTLIKKGDILLLGGKSGSRYQQIDFPRKNFIIKRGGIANFKSLVGEKLRVEALTIAKDGSTEAVLRRKNGRNFFRFYPTVTVNIEGALAESELLTPSKKK